MWWGVLPLGTKGSEIHEEKAPKGRDLRGIGGGSERERDAWGGEGKK
jgi:hypothetical protein